jgi:hypothetical protein
MILNSTYCTTRIVEDEISLITGETKTISSIHRTKVADIARQLTETSKDAAKLARMIRWHLNQGNPLHDAIQLAIKGGK